MNLFDTNFLGGDGVLRFDGPLTRMFGVIQPTDYAQSVSTEEQQLFDLREYAEQQRKDKDLTDKQIKWVN